MVYPIILILALLSGLLGRMGGAGKSGQWYDFLLDTKWRDIGCSLVLIGFYTITLGWHPWIYLMIFGLTWAAFATYWDKLFGYDNMWFSGLMVGLASYPLVFINSSLFTIVVIRSIILMVVWGCLTKYLPERVFIWRKDVADEYIRYFVSL